jgi:DNA-directed RNA polymerase specialized sigma24 family protein
MTDDPEAANACAKRAVTRSTVQGAGEFHGPVHPDRLARMERALRAMPRRTRSIFLAHRVDGLSYACIAVATGLSQYRVERHMLAAIRCIHRYGRGDERTRWQRWWQARLHRWLG